jgi:hypothetical protein
MLAIAKLIDGTFVFGTLNTTQGSIENIIRIDLINANNGGQNIHISPYIPFKPEYLPTIEKDKIMASYVIIDNEYDNLKIQYETIIQKSSEAKFKTLN